MAPGSIEMDARPRSPWKAKMRTPDGAEPSHRLLHRGHQELTPTHRLDFPGHPIKRRCSATSWNRSLTTLLILSQTCGSVEERETRGRLLDGIDRPLGSRTNLYAPRGGRPSEATLRPRSHQQRSAHALLPHATNGSLPVDC